MPVVGSAVSGSISLINRLIGLHLHDTGRPSTCLEAMLEQFLTLVAAEARAIAAVPVSFVGTLLIMAGIVYLATRWRYGLVISDLQQRLKLREDRLSEFSEKLHSASPDEARARLDAIEAQLAALRLQVPPRRLTDRQRVLLRDAIVRPVRVLCSIEIEHDMSCMDCKPYAQDLCSVFAAIPGWRVHALGFYKLEEIPSSGLGLQVLDPTNLTNTEFIVLNALQQAGIAHDVIRGRSEQTDVGLIVTVPLR
jgi:hypothetical protein